MKYLQWCFVGVLCVGIPFGILYDRYDLWGSVIGGAVGGAIFLIILYGYSWKHFVSNKERFLVGFVALFLIVTYGLQMLKQYEMSSYQSRLLQEMRTVIGAGIIFSDKIHETMMPVLRAYHRQPSTNKKSIVAVFHEMYAESIADSSFNKYSRQEYMAQNFDVVTLISYRNDTAVQLICVDSIANGVNGQFKNASGHMGKLEFKVLLSTKGVHYERIN